MLLPSLFRDADFDRFMSSFDPFKDVWGNNRTAFPSMPTDIKESENSYELTINLPGFSKEDIQIGLRDGYLTIKADHSDNEEEKDDEGNFIRRERYSGHLERSFYVGDKVNEKQIKAKFDKGILHLDVEKPLAVEGDSVKAIPIED